MIKKTNLIRLIILFNAIPLTYAACPVSGDRPACRAYCSGNGRMTATVSNTGQPPFSWMAKVSSFCPTNNFKISGAGVGRTMTDALNAAETDCQNTCGF